MVELKQLTILCAIISCSLSFMVMLTFLLFKRMRTKMFMRIIFYVSMSDFIANSTVFSGVPSDYYLCFMQGILQQCFYPSSWLWTTMLMYLLYSLVLRGKITISSLRMVSICCGIPLLCALLPLTTDTYESSNNDDDWCWIQPYNDGGFQRTMTTVWQVLTFDCLIIICFVLMSGWGLRIYWKLKVDQIPTTPAVSAALESLVLYPLILIVCWLPNEVMLIFFGRYPADNVYVVLANSLSILHGGFAALIFFYKSKECRVNWVKLWRRLLRFGARPERIFSFGDGQPDQEYAGLTAQLGSFAETPPAMSVAGTAETDNDIYYKDCCGSDVEDFADDEFYRGDTNVPSIFRSRSASNTAQRKSLLADAIDGGGSECGSGGGRSLTAMEEVAQRRRAQTALM